MKIKYLLTVMAIVVITKNSSAQFSEDALRFSVSQPGSTSRIKAIGNAGTAVGGDLSSISGNPAGVAFFTRSDASFTPEFNLTGVKASYLGQSNTANSNNLNFNNASVVFYSKLNTPAGNDKGQGWLSLNFGASYNRSADYYENITYGGTNKLNSISNYYANLANVQGIDNGNTLQDFALDHGLIDRYNIAAPGTGTTYRSNVFSITAPNRPVTQLNNTSREGGQTEFSFAFGGNYSNKLYLGMGIGITSIRYNMTRTFGEAGIDTLVDQNNNPYNANYNSTYTQLQSTTGTGFNARFGLIYKPVDAVRIGATFTTPTYYTMQDDYSEGLQTIYSGNATGNLQSGLQDYQTTYSFHTPLKVSGGIAVFMGNIGFISGDIEYVDYSSIHLSSGDGYDASSDNHDIVSNYKSTANAHIGAEFKLDQLYVRGGYGVQGNPQKTTGTNINTISGGLGYRFGDYYVDATYTNVNGTQLVTPYPIGLTSPIASLNKTTNNVFLTFGFRF